MDSRQWTVYHLPSTVYRLLLQTVYRLLSIVYCLDGDDASVQWRFVSQSGHQ
ncbi:hypothetical protein HYR99_07630 [Candidatus Poribacteria bacterium]|nr:hypothetical protein [Candidatus Poribacteria bacterium]